MTPPPALLVASSHVARGTVGLRAAVHAAEVLGHPTWSVPTVHLPWHPGRGPGTRAVWPPETFAAYCDDLARSPQLSEVGGMLTGYLGDASQAEALAGLIGALRLANPSAIVACDPVIGSTRGLYVPIAVAEAIRDRLVPLADIVTPNRHELAWLAGLDAVPPDNEGLAEAARELVGARRVLVTSAHAGEGRTGNLLVGGSKGRSEEGSDEEAVLAAHPRSDAPNSGTGDLTAALLLAHLVDGRPDALRRATASVSAVMALAGETGADELPLERARHALTDPDMGTVEMRAVRTTRLGARPGTPSRTSLRSG